MSDLEINFYFRKQEYGWLSNFYRMNQTVNGKEYLTNEHFYQSMKALHPENENWIAAAPNPFLAMKAGRSLREGRELVDNWDEIKVAIMAVGLRAKFFQNKFLIEKLLSTGTAKLHEDSPSDMFWGKKGRDMLGKLLMLVRQEIRDKPENISWEEWEKVCNETRDLPE